MEINVRDLTKKYRDSYALSNVSFSLDEPKIYGLLGRNGAGKTTFMDILAGNILPTKGDILVDGNQPFDNEQLMSSICLIKEGNNFDKELKIKNVFKIYSYFYPNWDMKLAHELAKKYNLDLNLKIKALSKGMESAVSIIVGLASKAPITIFDEPYIGLDAAARKKFYNILVEEYEQEPRMIIFSTHLIDEVSLLFEEVIIFRDGELVLQENTDNLREKVCAISGPVEYVENFIKNKQAIHKEQLAGMMLAYVFSDRETAKEAGLSVEGVPIQELMIYLTEEEGAEYAITN